MSAPNPKREFAVEVVRKLTEAGFQALWAGGCVRDFLLGIEPKDYDVATNAVPQQVRDLFGHRRTQAVGASFGVILLRGTREAGHIEIATFRTDGSYLDGRRPESVEFSTPEEDAKRRDFTINGMFYDPLEHKIHDFVGGEADLSAGVIRAIGDPHDRVREDKLRMLRAIRFSATLEFELDSVTADAIREMAAEIHVVSTERIAQELKRMLVDRHRMRAMELCRDVALLAEILPELQPILGEPGSEPSAIWDRTLHRLSLLQEPGFELVMAALLHDVDMPDNSEAVCRRLRLSNEESDRICWLLEHRHAIDDAERLPLYRLKRLLIHPCFADLLALVRVARLAANGDLSPVLFCEEYLRATPDEEINPPELIGGSELIAMNIPPGPRFKELLTAIRDAQLDGEIGTREEALTMVQRLQSDGKETM